MTELGCTYCKQKKCYYTDNHEAPENIKDRNFRYILEQDRLSSRQPVWVTVPSTIATESSLLDAYERTGVLQSNDSNEVYIHVDYLKGDNYV
jgi:hypothetical protein